MKRNVTSNLVIMVACLLTLVSMIICLALSRHMERSFLFETKDSDPDTTTTIEPENEEPENEEPENEEPETSSDGGGTTTAAEDSVEYTEYQSQYFAPYKRLETLKDTPLDECKAKCNESSRCYGFNFDPTPNFRPAGSTTCHLFEPTHGSKWVSYTGDSKTYMKPGHCEPSDSCNFSTTPAPGNWRYNLRKGDVPKGMTLIGPSHSLNVNDCKAKCNSTSECRGFLTPCRLISFPPGEPDFIPNLTNAWDDNITHWKS